MHRAYLLPFHPGRRAFLSTNVAPCRHFTSIIRVPENVSRCAASYVQKACQESDFWQMTENGTRVSTRPQYFKVVINFGTSSQRSYAIMTAQMLWRCIIVILPHFLMISFERYNGITASQTQLQSKSKTSALHFFRKSSNLLTLGVIFRVSICPSLLQTQLSH